MTSPSRDPSIMDRLTCVSSAENADRCSRRGTGSTLAFGPWRLAALQRRRRAGVDRRRRERAIVGCCRPAPHASRRLSSPIAGRGRTMEDARRFARRRRRHLRHAWRARDGGEDVAPSLTHGEMVRHLTFPDALALASRRSEGAATCRFQSLRAPASASLGVEGRRGSERRRRRAERPLA